MEYLGRLPKDLLLVIIRESARILARKKALTILRLTCKALRDIVDQHFTQVVIHAQHYLNENIAFSTLEKCRLDGVKFRFIETNFTWIPQLPNTLTIFHVEGKFVSFFFGIIGRLSPAHKQYDTYKIA